MKATKGVYSKEAAAAENTAAERTARAKRVTLRTGIRNAGRRRAAPACGGRAHGISVPSLCVGLAWAVGWRASLSVPLFGPVMGLRVPVHVRQALPPDFGQLHP